MEYFYFVLKFNNLFDKMIMKPADYKTLERFSDCLKSFVKGTDVKSCVDFAIKNGLEIEDGLTGSLLLKDGSIIRYFFVQDNPVYSFHESFYGSSSLIDEDNVKRKVDEIGVQLLGKSKRIPDWISKKGESEKWNTI